MRKNLLVSGSVLLFVFCAVDSANILAHFFVPSVSHQYVFQPIWKELSLRGHNVTVITPNPLKDPNLINLTEIDVSFAYNFPKDVDISNSRREFSSPFTIINTFYYLFKYTMQMQMEDEKFKNILKQSEDSFDLILVETGNMIGYGLKHKFNAPLISISSLPSSVFTQYSIGNPAHPVVYPDVLTESFGDLSIWQKIDSIYVLLTTWLMAQFFIVPDATEMGRFYFGEDMPDVQELMRQSVFLENVNPIFSNKRPNVPNMKEFWNVHLNRDINPPKVSYFICLIFLQSTH
ncbi:hypothetical protein WA026_018374 [Henosepilachna vigintioctopunctata]|uniref:UDP-glycosyltransferase n=1 Tax=Henosepilachna vigintioctopunctata TaxID=420089 RepID=A0AAW1VID7_9CUCU